MSKGQRSARNGFNITYKTVMQVVECYIDFRCFVPSNLAIVSAKERLGSSRGVPTELTLQWGENSSVICH